MIRFLALVLGDWVYKPFSLIIKTILILRGCRVGKNFLIMAVPSLQKKGGNIEFGDNVTIKGYLDIRTREKGVIIIGNNIKIDDNVRLIAANDALLSIGNNTNIGSFCIFNCGTNVTVGENCLIASFCYVQSSNHGIRRGEIIKTQRHTYKPISIGHDVWVGGSVNILPGAIIGDGCVIGAKSVVTKEIQPYCIALGIPAIVKKEREMV